MLFVVVGMVEVINTGILENEILNFQISIETFGIFEMTFS